MIQSDLPRPRGFHILIFRLRKNATIIRTTRKVETEMATGTTIFRLLLQESDEHASDKFGTPHDSFVHRFGFPSTLIFLHGKKRESMS